MPTMQAATDEVIAVLLIALRIGPTLGFAPPFTLMRIPVLVRVLASLALAASLASISAPHAPIAARLVTAAASELLLGVCMALSLQLAFAALQTAGRAVDFHPRQFRFRSNCSGL
ncbi:MAG: flagellar biosynthetic protein FliR [Terricaulis silvestris]